MLYLPINSTTCVSVPPGVMSLTLRRGDALVCLEVDITHSDAYRDFGKVTVGDIDTGEWLCDETGGYVRIYTDENRNSFYNG